MARKKHTIILDVVGLEYNHIEKGLLPNIASIAANGQVSKLKPVFPAVTCTVQASVLSGKYPQDHGIISNGLYDRNTFSVSFWEQQSSLVESDRIWDMAKSKDPTIKTAVLFWQNSMYADSDIVVTPRPLHTDTGMIMWCYSKPVGYYERLKQAFGEFNLAHYWGPLASPESSEWICKAAEYTIEKERPDLTFVYIPHVDYSAQRFGKNSPQAIDDLRKADDIVGRIAQKTSDLGIKDQTEFIMLSEYAFNDVNGAVPININLRDAGLLAIRVIQEKEYIDFELSKAFAMVDHQVAHVYVKDDYLEEAKKIIRDIQGIDTVLASNEEKDKLKINHPRSGDIIAISAKDKWFSYYWWYDVEKAPDFARKVDIHRKPGYDPVELFVDFKTREIPLDTSLVKGSHGRSANSATGEGYSLYVSSSPNAIQDHKDNVMKCTDIAGRILAASP